VLTTTEEATSGHFLRTESRIGYGQINIVGDSKEEESKDASEFGTECHALAEAYIKQSLKIEDFDEKPVSIDELKSTFKHYDDEMETLTTGYANFVIGQAISISM
jgi:hypothetical protein